MARPRAPRPVRLICGLLSADADLLRRGVQLLTRRYGPVAGSSAPEPSDRAAEYAAEMGPGLLRQFVAFERPVRPDELPAIKHETHALEGELAEQLEGLGTERPMNLNPGYLAGDKLVLASFRDGPGRVYVGSQVYAGIALAWAGGAAVMPPACDADVSAAAEFFARWRESPLAGAN